MPNYRTVSAPSLRLVDVKRYGPRTDDAIWALLSEKDEYGRPRYRTGEVLEIIRAGDPDQGIEPCPMPRRTFFDHVSKLRAERGDPADELPTTDAAALTLALEKQILETVQTEIGRLRRRQKRQGWSSTDIANVGRLAKRLDEIHKAQAKRQATVPVDKPSPEPEPEKPSQSLLNRLRSDLDEAA